MDDNLKPEQLHTARSNLSQLSKAVNIQLTGRGSRRTALTNSTSRTLCDLTDEGGHTVRGHFSTKDSIFLGNKWSESLGGAEKERPIRARVTNRTERDESAPLSGWRPHLEPQPAASQDAPAGARRRPQDRFLPNPPPPRHREPWGGGVGPAAPGRPGHRGPPHPGAAPRHPHGSRDPAGSAGARRTRVLLTNSS